MDYLTEIKKSRKLIKTLVIGSGAVGKTSLLKVLKSGNLLPEINEKYHRTLFMEFESIELGDEMTLMMMDVAGQKDLPIHALKDFERLSFGHTDLIILMFAHNSMQSFLDIQTWFEIVKGYFEKKKTPLPPILLVENKLDLEGEIDPSLPESLVQKVPEIHRLCRISLMDGTGLEDVRERIREISER